MSEVWHQVYLLKIKNKLKNIVEKNGVKNGINSVDFLHYLCHLK